MKELPTPLVPADADVIDFPSLMIDIVRLFSSEFHALASDSEWRAGVTLWLKAAHQVPAGSLPQDEIALTRLAELGRDTKAWRKVKAMALRGWFAASDGRLYHKVVAEKALEAWIDKLVQRKKSGAGNAARWGTAFDPGEIRSKIIDAATRLKALNPQSRIFTKRSVIDALKETDSTPSGNPSGTSNGDPNAVPQDAPRNPKRREGKGKDIIGVTSSHPNNIRSQDQRSEAAHALPVRVASAPVARAPEPAQEDVAPDDRRSDPVRALQADRILHEAGVRFDRAQANQPQRILKIGSDLDGGDNAVREIADTIELMTERDVEATEALRQSVLTALDPVTIQTANTDHADLLRERFGEQMVKAFDRGVLFIGSSELDLQSATAA